MYLSVAEEDSSRSNFKFSIYIKNLHIIMGSVNYLCKFKMACFNTDSIFRKMYWPFWLPSNKRKRQ